MKLHKVFLVQFPLDELFRQIPNRMRVLHQSNLAEWMFLCRQNAAKSVSPKKLNETKALKSGK